MKNTLGRNWILTETPKAFYDFKRNLRKNYPIDESCRKLVVLGDRFSGKISIMQKLYNIEEQKTSPDLSINLVDNVFRSHLSLSSLSEENEMINTEAVLSVTAKPLKNKKNDEWPSIANTITNKFLAS